MDIALARTFLEIVETGSFVAAAGRLNITQTAVSARIQSLEESLGRRLFVRNKSGARLTASGERFVRHATTLVQAWDLARRQVALPPGRVDIASVGAELSLWNPLIVDWLAWMRREAPDIALRAEIDTGPRLLDALRDGAIDIAVLYDPPRQNAATVVELIHEDKLVLVTSRPEGDFGPPGGYLHVDWGPSFQSSFHAAFPQLGNADISVSHGPVALFYLLRAGGTGYFRLSVVRPFIARGQLYRVAAAPAFAYSIHMVYSNRTEPGMLDTMRRGLGLCVPQAVAL